jgi:prephenate dehydrogenase
VNVAVIGLGLIGGSLLRALAAAGHEVAGFDADPTTRALAAGAGYRVAGSVPETTGGAAVVFLAVPLTGLPEVITGLAGHEGLITDVTSVKSPVLDLVRKHGLARFVGGHPMAGKETSGFAAADPALFAGCTWVLGLEPETPLDDWLTLAAICTTLGARVVPATAAEHDHAVAQVSHVPHLLAAALARQLAGNPLAGALAAGSFRDGTRVAATAPDLVRAMCEANSDELRSALDRAVGLLSRARDGLATTGSVAELVESGHGARMRYDGFPRPQIIATAIGEDGWRQELAAAGRAGGVVRSALPIRGSRG